MSAVDETGRGPGGSASLGADTPYSLVWQPLQIGPVTVRHRIMQPPHGVSWEGGNMPYPRQVAYYAERAKGGAALVCIGSTYAHRAIASNTDRPTTAAEPASVALFENLSTAVHAHDARIFIELGEGGVHGGGRQVNGTWGTSEGPSDIPSPVRNEIPAPVTRSRIRELHEDHWKAARNLAEGGIDGVTLHAAHSYLLGQFLSPAYNQRKDEYGGSAQNRCRLVIELAQQMREAVGDRLAIGVRLSYDEHVVDGQGITAEMSDEYLEIMLGSGVFDFFDISSGGYHSLPYSVPPMQMPLALHAADAKRAKAIVGDRAKIFAAGRILTVASAEELLRDGVCDMVGLTRAQVADPFLVNKTLEGREQDIQPCVGSNECVFSLHMRHGIVCTVNPAAGRERDWGSGRLRSVPTSMRKRVAVLGAGPAGMRAAAVAAERGHEVTLLEAGDALGGAINVLAALPTRASWNGLIHGFTRRIEAAGVDVRTNTRATVDAVRALAPDAVVVATGAAWDPTGFTAGLPGRPVMPGADLDHVLTVDVAITRAIADPGSLGRRVVIIDESDGYLPYALAEQLALGGSHVEIYSKALHVGERVHQSHELAPVMERLVTHDVAFFPQHFVLAVTASAVEVRSIWGGRARQVPDVDTVVLCMLRKARREIHDALAGVYADLHLIGDAWAPRQPADAVYDGEKVGRLL